MTESLAGGGAAAPLSIRAAATLTSAAVRAARQLLTDLERGRRIDAAVLRGAMEAAFGDSDAAGAWNWKTAYDVCEAATVLFLRKFGPAMRAKAGSTAAMLPMLAKITNCLPTHTRRSEDSQAFQQFSTPISLGLAACTAAGITPGDRVLEPSAGTGLLAILAELAGGSLMLNELAESRAVLLDHLFANVEVTRFDAAQIDDHLDERVVPSVVLMNPPFSAVANVDRRMADAAFRHIASSLARLGDGGRLVAIAGAGLAPDNPAWRDAFVRLQERGRVVFSAAIDGAVYAKHGTQTDTRLLVIDKLPAADPKAFPASQGMAGDVATLLNWVGSTCFTSISGNSFSVSGVTLNANASCVVVLSVQGTATGTYSYTTGQVSATGPSSLIGSTATTSVPLAVLPQVQSISPTVGPQTGGTSVIIGGQGLSGATAVKFGAVAATSFTINSNNEITATSPAGFGAVDVTVTTAGGTSATSAADQFTYVPAPTVTLISPTTGLPAGGTTITITGTDFIGVTSVRFGATNATSFTVNSNTSITATAPAGAGLVCVIVTAVGGGSGCSAEFYYVRVPLVSSISPTSGPTAGGTTVTILGTDFTGATAVTFGATAATTFTVNSDVQITATSPAGTGTVDIKVTTVGGTSATSAADQFTYAGVPAVTSISPTSGPLAGGTSVTITGSNFSGTTAVAFGATAATGFAVNSATQVTATAPAGTGTVDVRVTTAGGSSATSAADQFTYTAAPAVTSISPTSGPATGGTIVTVTGTGFTGSTAVTFGATAATSFTVNSATSITATSPAGNGTVDVRVTSPGGTSATSAADQLTYAAGPTVTSISPTSGPAVGGTSVTITGTGLTGATAVKFGTTNATSFTVNSATSITATSASGTGSVDVTVTTIGGTSATTAADRFTYLSSTTTTALISSQNPSSYGQAVTFTATLSSSGGTPTGTVTFSDGGVAIGTSSLSAGVATFATTALAVGNHAITATYNGSLTFSASTSPALTQSVDIPADSAKLRALQINATKVVAQSSGQAISGAIDSAISEGFSEGGQYVTPGAGSVRFNFAAAPDGNDEPQSGRQTDCSGSNAYAGEGATGRPSRGSSRVGDAFAAIDRAAPTKAPAARFKEQKDWLFWIDVRGTGIDRWGPSGNVGTGATQATLYGQQINLLSGLTYRAAPNLLVGVVGGYENFSYTETDINGKLKGEGWTVGAYLGWKIVPTIRYDAAVTYSGIGYDGTAGTAQGNFNGNRWMFATGFTGSYSWANFNVEPSTKVFALWEHENAYLDSLGTQQAARTFSSGRASAGNKVSYPVPWLDTVLLTPYVGAYADYYFTQDDAAAIVAAGGVPLASTPLLQGWSARVTGGIGARLASGTTVGFGAELGGIGGNTQIWTFAGRARVPF